MLDLYRQVCVESSKLITQRYSTSFSAGIRAFDKRFQDPIYAIYGFRAFRRRDRGYLPRLSRRLSLLQRFWEDTYRAIEEGISLNPVLQAFQEVVNKYGIERELIDAFLKSMEMDLHEHVYDQDGYEEYIYGSAEVVGLMCLRVFCEGDREKYDRLKAPASSLGAAFQKVNFLRDLKSDFDERGRVYFPGVDFDNFTAQDKADIEADIHRDFEHAYTGIVQLPKGARFGVYLAYVYYLNLLKKIKRAPANRVAEERIRVNDGRKVMLLFSSALAQ
jgi:phytoene synthase